MTALKPCHACGALKPATPAHFHRNADHYDGLETVCRPCRCAKSKAWKHHRNHGPARYATPPQPSGPACLVCGRPRRGNLCVNCGIGYVRRTRAA